MKKNRTRIFIGVSSLALLILLIIQINWISQTAKIKEEFFNEKANMVLARTAEAIGSDKATCKKMGDCLEKDSASELAAKLGKNEASKIDSLLKVYMDFYNFHIGYTFKVIKPIKATPKNAAEWTNYLHPGTYQKSLEEVANENGLELKLIFPEKKQYILSEMGGMFIASVILILVVLVLFWQTVRSLVHEKKISEHTTDFLNNMTHEFKTPLTNIALAGKGIIKEPSVRDDDKVKKYTEIILEENEKLKLQVEQVLGFTALERGEIPLQKSIVDFHELIRSSLKSMNMQIENKNGDVRLQLAAHNFKVLGEKTHLANVLCNLIDNAVKYAKENPMLTIETCNIGQNLMVSVSDAGIGIEKEYQNKVFDKYYRIPTGDVHNVKGFGLGLAYIKKIIEMHGGTITLFSEKGKGATFTITLPNA